MTDARVDDADPQVVAAAHRYCERVARGHYENFSVLSRLLPPDIRPDVAAIYAFARTADDLADEGRAAPRERLRRLDVWESYLDACFAGTASHPIYVALRDTIRRHDLPREPFTHLLEAFRRDVDFQPFARFEDTLDYCARSADPVGRLVLALFGHRDEARQRLSDRICTGLQLANFWQDVAVDLRKGRIYIPREDLDAFGVTEAELRFGLLTRPVQRLMAFEVERARCMLLEGLPLAEQVDPRLGRQVRLFAWGGLTILAGIEKIGYDVFRRRPTVSKMQKLTLLLRAWSGAASPPRAVRGAAVGDDAAGSSRRPPSVAEEH